MMISFVSSSLKLLLLISTLTMLISKSSTSQSKLVYLTNSLSSIHLHILFLYFNDDFIRVLLIEITIVDFNVDNVDFEVINITVETGIFNQLTFINTSTY